MAQYVAIGTTGAVITPLVYRPRTTTPRFVRLSAKSSEAVPAPVEDFPPRSWTPLWKP